MIVLAAAQVKASSRSPKSQIPMANPSTPITAAQPLVLASGSRYRAALLQRLGVPFEAVAADVDERRFPQETAEALAERLARTKASSLKVRFRERWILGSDQVASLGGQFFGKPGTRAAAIEQLALSSGRTLTFYTAVALFGPTPKQIFTAIDQTRVRFRSLTAEEIARYVDAEKPFDCAGSFRCEGLGIALFDKIESTDPTGLIGLPLIAVRKLLAEAGLSIP
jgi:septum formation protein